MKKLKSHGCVKTLSLILALILLFSGAGLCFAASTTAAWQKQNSISSEHDNHSQMHNTAADHQPANEKNASCCNDDPAKAIPQGSALSLKLLVAELPQSNLMVEINPLPERTKQFIRPPPANTTSIALYTLCCSLLI